MADQKLTELDASAGLATGDLLYVVDDPGGSAASQKATIDQVSTYMASSLAATFEAAGAVATHAALTATHGISGAIVGTTDAQTLTNKVMDSDDNSLYIHDVTLEVRKGSAGTITAGQVVYLSGYNPAGWYEVELADADDATKMPAVGIATASITNGASVQLVIFGKVSGLNTSSWSVLDSLYVNTTAGTLTNTRPTGATVGVQKVATVLRSHVSAGVIEWTGAFRSNDIPNRMLSDRFRIADSSDPTKLVRFIVSGVTTATERTLTVPDASDTLVLLTAAQTLTGKTLGATTLSGTLSAADQLVGRPVLKDYAIELSAIGNTGASRTFDLESANAFTATLDQASAFTFSNPPASGDLGGFMIYLTNGGSAVITWPASVDWAGGSAPTLTAAGLDILQFTTVDGGTTWHGVVLSTDSK